MKRVQGAIVWIAALFFLAGCAATAPTVAKPEITEKPEIKERKEVSVVAPAPPVMPPPPAPSVEKSITPPAPDEDGDLFSAGIALISHPNQPDMARARAVFALLVERYPQSRWRSASETLIRLIDQREVSREAGRQDRLLREKSEAERTRFLQENEHLKKTVRELTEKMQAGTASLSQENEQLKKDIQRLKTLEIELEKRERMLR